MSWTLLIIVGTSGLFSGSVAMTPVPMASQDACVSAAKAFNVKAVPNVGAACISSMTGEVIRADDARLKP